MHIYKTLKTINGKSLMVCQNRANSKIFFTIYDKKTHKQNGFGCFNKKGAWVPEQLHDIFLTKKEENVLLEYIKNF